MWWPIKPKALAQKPDSIDNTITDLTKAQATIDKTARNWYDERYDKAIVQRNILFVLAILLIFLIFISIIAVTTISNSKSYEPFVIQIDETTGFAKIVHPLANDELLASESLSQYFVKKYVVARETYNSADYQYSKKLINLFSSQTIYWQYIGYIKDPANDLSIKYTDLNSTYLRIKSWSKLDNLNTKYMVRFSIHESTGAKLIYNKIAIVEFAYKPMSLNNDELDINPVGFQVIGYRVDDDKS